MKSKMYHVFTSMFYVYLFKDIYIYDSKFCMFIFIYSLAIFRSSEFTDFAWLACKSANIKQKFN